MNQSCQSSHPELVMVSLLSLLYTIVLRSNGWYSQSLKSYYMSTCRRHVGKFLLIGRHEKKISMTALQTTQLTDAMYQSP